MAIKIHGYYTDYETENYSYTDSNGQTKTGSRTKEVEVTDFKFTIDLSNYIIPYGKLHIIPNKKYPNIDIMGFLKEYIENKNLLKEIEMRKMAIWDYDSLTKAISSVIRQQGYNNNLCINYPIRNYIKSFKDQLRSDFQINISPRDWF
ncbi:hypothetical protein Glove_87g65 [Diversispora epigaea]|uniref:Uncharacterized protein n=1 Tax=Diversispora epigaea TaxID=1348612 RepID=A0A397JGQ3_9GLOM|nr:hypothetical protein Glove_87g65 [Diversispora epigaea]